MFKKSKKNRTFFLAVTLTIPLLIMTPGSIIINGVLSTPLINVNYQQLVSSGDVHHTGIITTSRHGMPMGTGSMGSLVWSKNDHSLNFQINRVDVFGWNSAATGSLDGHNDNGYGCGFLNVDLGGNPLASSTSQYLSLYDGKLVIQGNGVKIEIIGDTHSDVFALKINDTRSYPSSINIDLVMLQDPDEVIGTHKTTTKTSNSGGQIRLKQIFEQPSATGYKQFDHYCSSAIVADVAGRTGKVSYPDSRTVRLTLPPATGTAYVFIGSHASLDRSDEVINLAADKVISAKTRGFDSICSSNRSWWQNFWSKSYIYLPADSTTLDIQRKWFYFLYISAISQRGDYPAKFAGNLFHTGGQHKRWGATQYWGYNQEPLHYSFDAANHNELQEPVFKMYLNNYDNYAAAAKQQWGSQGIFINETDNWNGPELLPSNIANDLRDFMINGNGPSKALGDFANARNRMHSRWELWPTYWTTFTTINASEKAEHFWNHYLYTLDTSFLSTHAYTMLKGVSEFYRNFPNLKLEDGKYHIYRTNLHEHIMGGKDIIDDLTFIKGVMQSTIKASEILGIDSNLRPLWQVIVDNLTSYPISGQLNTIGSITHPLGYTTWGQARIPAAQVRYDAIAQEPQSPRLRMLENYDVLTLETKDQGLDGGDWDIANNSFEANVAYNMNLSLGDYGSNLSRFLLDAAALGRSEFNIVLNNLNSEINSKVESSTNRLGFVTTDWAEFGGYGILSAGLQDGLMQSISATPGGDPVIRVFPAWDKNKPAYFKLLAKGGFLVSSSVKNGEVSFLEINSQLGGTCRIRNPWPGSTISLYRNGVKTEDLTGYLISFETSKGEDIKIVRQGINPDSFYESIPLSNAQTQAPKSFGPVPNENQIRWQEMEYYAFLHFSLNTFTDQEWGTGDESAGLFNPKDLDCRQWARVCREAGMKGIILTVKHHCGFCLWPSKYTEFSVKNSPWKDGKGDVVRELADACKEYGLKLGVYLSPWDRNSADYGKPEYITYFRNQLTELLTNYGPIFEVWFDGANGGTGYYGGARENRRIDRKTYYDWQNTYNLIRKLQPEIVIWNDGGDRADLRWVGTESGYVGETNWSLLNATGDVPEDMLRYGVENGDSWVPGEVNTSIRPGWFYHTYEDQRVKTLPQLLNIYYSSVGRNGTLLLNFPIDTRGLIHENDVKASKDLAAAVKESFAVNLAEKAKVTATNIRGNSKDFDPGKVIDSNKDTYWATDDGTTSASLTIDFPKLTTFNRFLVQEYIRLGQRVKAFTLEALVDGTWKEVAKATTIGYKRILRFPGVKATGVRFTITDSKSCPVISNMGIYNAPEILTSDMLK